MLTSILLAFVMQSPELNKLAAWKDVPMRQKVRIGIPFLKPIHPNDLKHLPKPIACYSFIPPSLQSMCYMSHIIAVGTFSGVLRYGHSPLNSTSMHQETIYAFRVEKYLKGDYGPWLKVRQSGGPLPWEEEGAKSYGFIMPDNPFPVIGSRYIIFLKDPKIELFAFSKSESVYHEENGVRHISYFTDEMSFTNPLYGKLHLNKGIVEPLEDKWSFEIGTQILGKKETEAISLISACVGADAARLKRYDDDTEKRFGVRPIR